MIALATKFDKAIEPLRHISTNIAAPALLLAIRLFMADIFFTSGMLKFKNLLNGQWDNTIMAFEDFHPIPGVPAEIAAIFGTGGELILPILLAFGLFGRFGAAGLLLMTLAIQFLVPAEYDISNPDHYFWMLLLAVPLVMGTGAWSLDHLLLKKIRK